MTFRNLILTSSVTAVLIAYPQLAFSAENIEFSNRLSKINSTPKEVWVDIFNLSENKSNIRLISKKFRSLLNEQIKVLKMEKMRIPRDYDIHYFSCFITELPNLTSLSLNYNSLGSGVESIWQVTASAKLTSLDLRANNINKEGVAFIWQALTKNTTLTSLNLGGNKVGDEGMNFLSKCLDINTTLRSLHLRINEIGAGGANLIGQGLRRNNTLTTLDLSSNMIRIEGAKFIIEGLRENTTLTALDLWNNNIGDDETQFALKELTNTTLISLDLGGGTDWLRPKRKIHYVILDDF